VSFGTDFVAYHPHMQTPLTLPSFKRLIIMPIVLAVLMCIVLGYGMRSAEQWSLAVDESDIVISHANNLMRLMVDEETGLRGYLLTSDPVFLEPYNIAIRNTDSEFILLFDLVAKFPDQTNQLTVLQAAHRDWIRGANIEISSLATSSTGKAVLLDRKQKMDLMRGQIDGFTHSASIRRSQTLAHVATVNRILLFGIVDLAILLAAFLIWQIQRGMQAVVSTHLEIQALSSKSRT
jgi:CHASE3 domain sensor protein